MTLIKLATMLITGRCQMCGGEFSYQRTGRGPIRSTCEGCDRQRSRHGLPPRQKRRCRFECLECGASFEAVPNGRNKFCSVGCRTRVNNRTKRHALTCVQCGAPFDSQKRTRKFCSPRCRNDANCVEGSEKTGNHRARCLKFDVPYDPSVRREQVLDRDDWTCWLCGDAIPDDVPYPDSLYGTVDHVIPLSKGGAHSWDNVRAAHLFCNCSRGAKDATRPTTEAT